MERGISGKIEGAYHVNKLAVTGLLLLLIACGQPNAGDMVSSPLPATAVVSPMPDQPLSEETAQTPVPKHAEDIDNPLPAEPERQEYPVPAGSRPHDVVPAPDGTVWDTAQRLGELGRLDPATGETHHIPLSDFGANALVRFDPEQEPFQTFPRPSPGANIRQILGRTGEVWGAESGADKLIVIRTQ